MSLDWANGTEFIGTRNDPALTPIAELTDKEKKAVTHVLTSRGPESKKSRKRGTNEM